MTPPGSECPASSELLRSSSRSQGISDGGVNDGAIWPQLCTLNTRIEIRGERPALPVRRRIRGSVCFLNSLVRLALAGRTGLDDPELSANPYSDRRLS